MTIELVHSRPRRVGGLDAVRALAAGLVILHHAHAFTGVRLPGFLDRVGATGWVGVEIFFAISGFVLFLPWARGHHEGTRPKVRRFWGNRARRILPAFLLNLFVVVVFLAPSLLATVAGLKTVALHATFLATAPGRDGRTLGQPVVNGIYWTLAAEMIFYLVLPLVARCFVGRRWMVAVPLVVVAGWGAKLVLIGGFDGTDDGHGLNVAARLFPFVADEFLAGMVLAAVWAELEHRGCDVPSWAVDAALLFGVLGVVAVLYVIQSVVGPTAYWNGTGGAGWWPLLTLKPLISAFAATAIFGVCWSSTTAAGRLFRVRWLTWLGTISYGLYLWQIPVQKTLLSGLPPGTSPRVAFLHLVVLGTLLTVAWAALSWYAVERPCIRRRPGPPATALDTPLDTPRDIAPGEIGLLSPTGADLPRQWAPPPSTALEDHRPS